MIPDAFHSDLRAHIRSFAENFVRKDGYVRSSCPGTYGWKYMLYLFLPASVYLALTSHRIVVVGNKYTSKPDRFWGYTELDQVAFDEVGRSTTPQLLMVNRGKTRRVHLSEYFSQDAEKLTANCAQVSIISRCKWFGPTKRRHFSIGSTLIRRPRIW